MKDRFSFYLSDEWVKLVQIIMIYFFSQMNKSKSKKITPEIKEPSGLWTMYGLTWVIKPKLITVAFYYNSKSTEILLFVSYLIIGLKGVTKNIQMERKYSFIYQNTSPWSKRGSITRETFEKKVSNKLAPKIKPTN